MTEFEKLRAEACPHCKDGMPMSSDPTHHFDAKMKFAAGDAQKRFKICLAPTKDAVIEQMAAHLAEARKFVRSIWPAGLAFEELTELRRVLSLLDGEGKAWEAVRCVLIEYALTALMDEWRLTREEWWAGEQTTEAERALFGMLDDLVGIGEEG